MSIEYQSPVQYYAIFRRLVPLLRFAFNLHQRASDDYPHVN